MSLLTSLYAYYKMEGNANDELGSYNGSLVGTYNFGLSYGKILQGFNTGGSSGYAEIGTTSDFTFFHTTGECTISVWMKLNSYLTANIYPIGNTGTSSQKGFFFGNNAGTGRFAVFVGNGIPGTLINASYTNLFTDNNWHHIVVTASDAANQVYFYKDGVQLTPTSGATVGTVTTGNANNTTRFGYNQAGAWIGDMDELGIWSRALAPSEVTELYNAGAGLTYPFTQGNSNFFQLF
jgi:hypothetical protein